MNTNLIGTINAIQVALPHLGEGASIIATGSVAALMEIANNPNLPLGADTGGACQAGDGGELSRAGCLR